VSTGMSALRLEFRELMCPGESALPFGVSRYLPAVGERIGDLASNSEAFRLTRNGSVSLARGKGPLLKAYRPCWDVRFRHRCACRL
jgi:hypothetical protein